MSSLFVENEIGCGRNDPDGGSAAAPESMPVLRIGDLSLAGPFVMAPMAGITNVVFRRIVRRLGAGLAVTEMISAVGLTLEQPKTLAYLASDSEESPFAVQIFGADPQSMAQAARMAQEAGASLVDINMGCPARKVVKTGAGGALLRDAGRAGRIVSEVRSACRVPVTVKMRAGWSGAGGGPVAFGRVLQEAGADALTLHARSVAQGFSGSADWGLIRDLKENLQIPVIGNGDAASAALAVRMKRETGCDGVMIGRAAVGNPWIFEQATRLLQGLKAPVPSLADRKSMIVEHHRMLSEHFGALRASRMMRGLLHWYTRGLPHSTRFRHQTARMKGPSELREALERYFDRLASAGLENEEH